jgi:hypothetical protein
MQASNISAENCRLHPSKSLERGTAGTLLQKLLKMKLSSGKLKFWEWKKPVLLGKGGIYYCGLQLNCRLDVLLAKLWRRITGCPFIKVLY